MKKLTALALVAAVLVTGCSDEGEELNTDATASTSPESSTTVEATTTTALATTTTTEGGDAPSTTTEPATESPLVLSGDGLGVVPFGSSVEVVLDSLEPLIGSPTADESAECPSGAERVVTFDDLRLVISGGFLVGYVYGNPLPDSGPPAATAEGLTLGATEAELLSTYPDADVFDSSLGVEFTVTVGRGDIGGLLTGTAGEVESIWAGDPCAFR